jgi:hypothetical protein
MARTMGWVCLDRVNVRKAGSSLREQVAASKWRRGSTCAAAPKAELFVCARARTPQAIGENIVTIAKKRARVAALEEELRQITGEAPVEGAAEALEPEAVPLEEPATAGAEAAAGSGSAQAAQGPRQDAEAMEVDGVGSRAPAAPGAPAPAGADGAGAPWAGQGSGTGAGNDGRAAAVEDEGVWL